MDTLSSTMISASNNNNVPMSRKIENSNKGFPKSMSRIGALIDITNDSPIAGVAMGKLETPSSAMSKKRTMNPQSNEMCTPGSGEALLRCQVKTLLQKVEEEAQISKISLENKQFLNFQGFVNSPISLLAPTPANTPQIENLLGSEKFKNVCLAAVTPSPIQEQFMISQMVGGTGMFNVVKQGGFESEKNVITRSLFFDFSEKSEGSDSSDCSSVNEGDNNNQAIMKALALEDDSSSVWCLQVSPGHDDDVELPRYGIEEDDHFVYEGDEVEDQLCEGILKISVNGVKFEGRHTRFMYNSDGEFDGEEGVILVTKNRQPF